MRSTDAEESPRWNTFFFWISGRLRQALGDLEEAEMLFMKARAIFEEQGSEYDSALVGLDLLGLYVRTHRIAESVALSEDVLPVFERYRLAPETREALSLLAIGIRRHHVEAHLFQTVVLHLEHARRCVRREDSTP